MLQLNPARKNKINLTDYESDQDISNRILMSDFCPADLDVLEEILYSSLKISRRKLFKSLDLSEEQFTSTLDLFAKGGLLSISGDTILIDKEMRKYFEFQIQRFAEDFHPDMEFIQGLLKKVPIHVLPTWYSLPRSSNNIFESVVEKYLLSPQIYQRYLLELNFGDARVQGIANDVLQAPGFQISSSDLIAKYNLTRREFEEILLILEFNFVCFVHYIREEDHWHEVVSPIYEWSQYLRFLKETEAPIILDTSSISKKRERDYAFLEDITTLLLAAKKGPVSTNAETIRELLKSEIDEVYLSQLLEKMQLIRLAECNSRSLKILDAASEFLEMNWENKALYLYRHSQNSLLSITLSSEVANERNLREAEKAIRRILHGGWVYADDYVKSSLIALSEHSVISLKKTGRHWAYSLPVYSAEEKELIKAVALEHLFEVGIVSVGSLNGRECLAVTSFGRFFFEE